MEKSKKPCRPSQSLSFKLIQWKSSYLYRSRLDVETHTEMFINKLDIDSWTITQI